MFCLVLRTYACIYIYIYIYIYVHSIYMYTCMAALPVPVRVLQGEEEITFLEYRKELKVLVDNIAALVRMLV